ncbi:MAG: hypothetical protein HZB92_01540 [Euryarchaeota archaeon]|nr:hypothetical protein [Euryarchaeota archaeon]
MTGEWDAVYSHLLFHKAIVKEDGDDAKINEYMEMVRQMEQGMHIISSDPIEKAISIAFQLVEEQQFNPWNIDLAEFTKLYMKRIRSESEVNFVIAGKLVLMAWSILRMQSTEILGAAEPPTPAEIPMWDMGDIYTVPEDLDYRDAILSSQTAALSPAIRSEALRPVTLMELIDALGEARQDILMNENLRRAREAADAARGQDPNIGAKLHRESLQEDIRMTWERICMFNGEPIPLKSLYQDDPWDRVAVFVSVLFLAKERRIKLSQDSLPYGEIYVKNLQVGQTAQDVADSRAAHASLGIPASANVGMEGPAAEPAGAVAAAEMLANASTSMLASSVPSGAPQIGADMPGSMTLEGA